MPQVSTAQKQEGTPRSKGVPLTGKRKQMCQAFQALLEGIPRRCDINQEGFMNDLMGLNQWRDDEVLKKVFAV